MTEEEAAWLIVLEDGTARCVELGRRPCWTLGRETPGQIPDIPLRSAIAGRAHGEFLHMGTSWFYCDGRSVNGTHYNGRRLVPGRNTRPVMLKNGDTLLIGSGADPRDVQMLFTAGLTPGAQIAMGGKILVYLGNGQVTERGPGDVH